MTRQQLEELVLRNVRVARDEMVLSGGVFKQRALLIDGGGTYHGVGIEGAPLHGSHMADLLRTFARALGGIEAIVVVSDARMKVTTPEEREAINLAAKRGKYLIAEDESAQEALIVCGRSREHTAGSSSPYRREPGNGKDRIVFIEPEPKLFEGKHTISLIPNLWEQYN
jgi:hypothetical protein